VNRKARATEPSVKTAPKEAESETCGATYRNRIGGGADQGERAIDREALAIKEGFVNPALVQGQPMVLPGEISRRA
jgi:hypothetical protein